MKIIFNVEALRSALKIVIVPTAKLAAIVNACKTEKIELAGKGKAEVTLTAAGYEIKSLSNS